MRASIAAVLVRAYRESRRDEDPDSNFTLCLVALHGVPSGGFVSENWRLIVFFAGVFWGSDCAIYHSFDFVSYTYDTVILC